MRNRLMNEQEVVIKSKQVFNVVKNIIHNELEYDDNKLQELIYSAINSAADKIVKDHLNKIGFEKKLLDRVFKEQKWNIEDKLARHISKFVLDHVRIDTDGDKEN